MSDETKSDPAWDEYGVHFYQFSPEETKLYRQLDICPALFGKEPTRFRKFLNRIHPSLWPEPIRAGIWICGMPIAFFVHFFSNTAAERMAAWLDANFCH